MKLLYLLAILMLVGIFLIVVCSAKVLNDLHAKVDDGAAQIQPMTQGYVVGTYVGLTFFIVGAVGSILALFQAMRR